MLRNFEWAAKRIVRGQIVDDSVIDAACEELEIFAMASEEPWRKDVIASMQKAIRNHDKEEILSIMENVADMVDPIRRDDLEKGARQATDDLVDLVDGNEDVAHKIINDMCDRNFLLFFASPEDKMACFLNENEEDLLVLKIEFVDKPANDVDLPSPGSEDAESWFDEHEEEVFDVLFNRLGMRCRPKNLLGGKLVICRKEE